MASDGLLMNFEVTDAPADFKLSVKGGSWKQRRQLKKRLEGKRRSPVRSTEDTPSDKPPKKKLRIDNDVSERGRQTKSANAKPREVVSSLFSYNPVAKEIESETEEKPTQDVAPSNAPLPEGIDSFMSLGISQTLASHLMTKMEVRDPTAIQKAAISRLLQEDSDAFIQAQTGSGKTLAYLLPLVQKLIALVALDRNGDTRSNANHITRHSGLFAIVLAPTRELAKQISVVLEKLLRCAHWLVAGTVIGGEKKKSEKARLRKGLNILIATPGRLVDHLAHTDVLDVSQVRWLVLDEGDRLMELGFEQDIKMVVDRLEHSFRQPKDPNLQLPTRRTTILCSATMRMNVQRLGEISLKDALHIQSDTSLNAAGDQVIEDSASEPKFSAPAQLKQSYVIAPPKQRLVTLHALLKHTFARKGSVMKAIVFLTCADSVEFHFTVFSLKRPTDGNTSPPPVDDSKTSEDQHPNISDAPTLTSPTNPGLKIYKLHGSLAQSVRTSTLGSFSRTSEPAILFCTDVASRGLDLPSIDLVVEYDPAFSAEDHLHRIGRTARAGREGRAMVFLMPGSEETYVEILKKSYSDTPGATVARHHAEEVMKRGFSLGQANGARDAQSKADRKRWDDGATEYQLEVERRIVENTSLHELARKAYISHVRAYATHIVPERHIFDIKGLHLGHLAKAFGLRDQPTNMGRSKTGGSARSKRNPQATRDKRRPARSGQNEDDHAPAEDRDDAAQRMRRAMKTHMNAASEFNIG